MKWRPLLAVLSVAVAAVAFSYLRPGLVGTGSAEGGGARADESEAASAPTGPVRFVAVGGGSLPANTEVSLEQDLALAIQVLPGPGVSLFAAGASGIAVRELAQGSSKPSLRVRLGELFAPNPTRRSRYRRPKLAVDGPASRTALEQQLQSALSVSTSRPLVLYMAGHGQQGPSPADNHVLLWGGDTLDVRALARLHDGARRPLRAVVTSCFSGGFGELAFVAADPDRGPVQSPSRCGLFAGTWDRPTSGCDPNPDRRAQESYSVHFLSSLRGTDRDGRVRTLAELDYDGDGHVGLRDAHARATSVARTIDVPTTTSDRFLRHIEGEQVEQELGPQSSAQGHSPLEPREEARVLSELGERLHLGTLAAARARLAQLQTELDARDADLLTAERVADASYQRLAAVLLSQYPALEDAFRSDFESTLTAHREDITRLLDTSSAAKAYRTDQARLVELDRAFLTLQVEESQVLRYVRTHETLVLARRLARRGGPDWRRYLGFLACERGEL